MGSTTNAAERFQKSWSQRKGKCNRELLDNRRYVVTLTFKPHYPNVTWNMYSPGCQHLSTKCTVPRGSYHSQTSCWNMLEQLKGEKLAKVYQYPLNQTANLWWAQNIILSSLVVPNFTPWKLVKCSQRGWNIWRTWNRMGNIVLLVRFSLWHGSVCMCKSFFTVTTCKRSLSVTFQAFLGVFLC